MTREGESDNSGAIEHARPDADALESEQDLRERLHEELRYAALNLTDELWVSPEDRDGSGYAETVLWGAETGVKTHAKMRVTPRDDGSYAFTVMDVDIRDRPMDFFSIHPGERRDFTLDPDGGLTPQLDRRTGQSRCAVPAGTYGSHDQSRLRGGRAGATYRRLQHFPGDTPATQGTPSGSPRRQTVATVEPIAE